MSETDEVPFMLKYTDQESEVEHVFVRTDWLAHFLFDHLPYEDAVRAWTKMHAVRIRAEEGEEAAQAFLDAFGILEH